MKIMNYMLSIALMFCCGIHGHQALQTAQDIESCKKRYEQMIEYAVKAETDSENMKQASVPSLTYQDYAYAPKTLANTGNGLFLRYWVDIHAQLVQEQCYEHADDCNMQKAALARHRASIILIHVHALQAHVVCPSKS